MIDYNAKNTWASQKAAQKKAAANKKAEKADMVACAVFILGMVLSLVLGHVANEMLGFSIRNSNVISIFGIVVTTITTFIVKYRLSR